METSTAVNTGADRSIEGLATGSKPHCGFQSCEAVLTALFSNTALLVPSCHILRHECAGHSSLDNTLLNEVPRHSTRPRLASIMNSNALACAPPALRLALVTTTQTKPYMLPQQRTKTTAHTSTHISICCPCKPYS